jgi:hypothetical protein
MKSANAITILTYISERWQRTLAINAAFEFAIPSPAKDKLSLPVAAAEYPATIYPPHLTKHTVSDQPRKSSLGNTSTAEHICRQGTKRRRSRAIFCTRHVDLTIQSTQSMRVHVAAKTKGCDYWMD